MIGRLHGKIIEKTMPLVLIDVNGIGYEIETSLTTFFRLPDVGTETILLTHLVVREDAHILYGFIDTRERALFRTLIKVNGVGPKLALTILSSVQADAFVHYVRDNDTANLVRIPGIGKKTAERLIIEMRDKLSTWELEETSGVSAKISAASSASAISREAVSALVGLGYKPQEASRAVARVEQENITSEELIRLALRSMVQND